MQEHAIAIARVSQGKQRSEDQRPGLVAYAERKGYILDELVVIQGRSAFHGRHVKAILNAIDKHVKHGMATVVIFRHVDRSSRQGAIKGFDLIGKIMDAGARVEWSEQEFLNQQKTGILGLFFDMAEAESEIKRDRKLQGNTVKRANGQMVGKKPWGYDAVLDARGIQVGIVPNDMGRKWIPIIFHSAVEGKSLRSIAEMLKGIPSPQKNNAWNNATIRRIIISTSYYGSMPGNPNMKFEPLVSVELYKQANLAMKSRLRRGRGTVKNEPALCKPVCGECYGIVRDGAPSGRSPMYRTKSIQKGTTWTYYRCAGHGPASRSCGAPLIPLAALDKAVDETMSADTREHKHLEYTAGDDRSEQRTILLEKAKAAMDDNDLVLSIQLTQEAMAIGPTEHKASVGLVPSGMTVGKHWESLDPEGKREELLKWEVIAYYDHVKIVGPWHDEPGRTVIGDMMEAEDTP